MVHDLRAEKIHLPIIPCRDVIQRSALGKGGQKAEDRIRRVAKVDTELCVDVKMRQGDFRNPISLKVKT